jgi:hypothetical protein
LCATAQFWRYFVKFPTLDPLLHAYASPFYARSTPLLSLFKKRSGSNARSGIALADGSFALAVVKRGSDAKPAIEYCATHTEAI